MRFFRLLMLRGRKNVVAVAAMAVLAVIFMVNWSILFSSTIVFSQIPTHPVADAREYSHDAEKRITINDGKCRNDDRITTMRNTCKLNPAKGMKLPPSLQGVPMTYEAVYNLTDQQLRDVVRNIISDEKHKVLYCAIPKAGCSTWKRLFLRNTDQFLRNETPKGYSEHDEEKFLNSLHSDGFMKSYGLPRLNTMSRNEIFTRLNNYFSMITVRHPLDRLVSGYNDKLVRGNKYYEYGLGIKILKKYRARPDNDSLQTGIGVSFSEFLQEIQYIIQSGSFIDPHWENYHKSCFPCLIRYDYIAKLETSVQDINFIATNRLSGELVEKAWNSQRGGGPTLTQQDNDNVTLGLNRVLAAYSGVSTQLFNDVLQYYTEDMDLFGYSAWRDVMQGTVRAKCGATEGGCC